MEEILKVCCSQERASEMLVRGGAGSGGIGLPVYFLLSSFCGTRVELKPFLLYASALSLS